MHRRLRWGNVARAAGAALAVALVVAWPRLAPPEPALPGTKPAPLVDRGWRPPMERVDGAAKRDGGGERRRRTDRAGGQQRGARRRTIRAEADRAARRRTIRAGGREERDGAGSGGENGEGRATVPDVGGEGGETVPDVGGDGEGATTVPDVGGNGEGGTTVPGDERVAAPTPDPAPVEFGFERP